MSKKCFVCGNRIGFFSPSALTKDGKDVCIDDANRYFGTGKTGNGISVSLALKIRKLTSEEILHKITGNNANDDREEQEYENEVNKYKIVDLSKLASKTDDVKLAKTEYVYFATYNTIFWKEERNKSVRINYGGLTGRIHIAKGLNYRLGSIKTQMQHEKYWEEILQGRLLLTDRRIILVNHEGAKAYRFTNLLKVVPFSDAVLLVSESGKQTILDGFWGHDAEIFDILLNRLTAN